MFEYGICVPAFICAVPMIAPENVTISEVNATAIYLTWDGVLTQAGILRSYVIRVLEEDTGTILEYRTSLMSITISVHPDYVYRCSISVFTVATGPFSDVVTVRTPQAGKYKISDTIYGNLRALYLTFSSKWLSTKS